jgi:hypothetical protein
MNAFARRCGLFLAAALLTAGSPLGAGDDTVPSPSPGEPNTKVDRPPVIPPPAPSRSVAIRGTPPTTGDSADAGRWKAARALAIRPGEADVLLTDGGRLHLRPGDVVGPDTVQRIEPGQIVLARRASETSPPTATVVVTFDDAGRGRARVYWLQDPKAAAPPTVK